MTLRARPAPRLNTTVRPQFKKGGAMNEKQARFYIDLTGELPCCEHGHKLMDGSYEALEPPCGCRLTPLALDAAGSTDGGEQERDAAQVKLVR